MRCCSTVTCVAGLMWSMPPTRAAGSGQVAARPGIVRLMGEAQAAGVPVAVCSAATKSAVEFVLGNLLGKVRWLVGRGSPRAAA